MNFKIRRDNVYGNQNKGYYLDKTTKLIYICRCMKCNGYNESGAKRYLK